MTGDAVLAVLGEIRDEIRMVRDEVRTTNERLGHVETAMLDVAEQQRFVVKWLRAGTERDRRLERDVEDLQARVGALESKAGSSE